MYKSEAHTPVSNCSAGTGVYSLGPAGSIKQSVDDFDRQLKERLEAVVEKTTIRERQAAAEAAAQKVSSWKQNIDDLLDGDDTSQGMADPYISANQVANQLWESDNSEDEDHAGGTDSRKQQGQNDRGCRVEENHEIASERAAVDEIKLEPKRARRSFSLRSRKRSKVGTTK